MQGEIYPRNAVPATVDRKYFWRVYDKQTNDVSFFVDGKDVRRANWMRYVLPAYINAAQVQREGVRHTSVADPGYGAFLTPGYRIRDG